MNDTWDGGFETLLRDVLPTLGALEADTCLRSHGLDSLATVDLLLRLEDAYAVSIPDQLLTADTFGTPAALWRALGEVREAQRPLASTAGGQ